MDEGMNEALPSEPGGVVVSHSKPTVKNQRKISVGVRCLILAAIAPALGASFGWT
jgi:hypothetical protein